MFTGHAHHWCLPHVKCLSYYDIWRAGSHHLRKHSTFGLCCSIMEQNKDFNCQLKRKILICINICDINVFSDSEIFHSKQIKLIKTSTSFWHYTPIPNYLSGALKIGAHHRFLNHILNQEEGQEKGRRFAVCARH